MKILDKQRESLEAVLDRATVEGDLYEKLDDGKVQYHACKVRHNDEGTLRVPFGYAAGVQGDPVEKKPYFHVMPGCRALLIGRYAYVILAYHLTDDGCCPKCSHSVPGLWPESSDLVRTGTRRDVFHRRPRLVDTRMDG